MVSSSQTIPDSRSRRELFSARTLLIIVLIISCATPFALWLLGFGLENGEGAGAVVAVIFVTASIGELIRGRFRLSLKLWLIAFTAVAVLLGLYAQHLVTAAKQHRAAQRVRALGGSVHYDFTSDSGDWFITRQGVVLPGWFRSVFSSDAFGRVERISLPLGCRDEDLEAIFQGITEIAALDTFNRKNITGDGLRHLLTLDQLHSLYLNGQQATAAGFEHLSQLPKLEELGLLDRQVTDETLAHLASLPHLKRLWLYRSAVTDAGMQHLSDLTQLENLHLGGAAVGDGGVVHLRPLHELRVLVLGSTSVSDASVLHLKELKNLRHLNLANTKVTDAAIEHLSQLPHLSYLSLAGTQVSDAVIEDLSRLPALERVDLPPLDQARLESFKRKHPAIEVSVWDTRSQRWKRVD